MSEQHRRAALARWAKAPAREPYNGTILDAMTAAGLVGPSWDRWRTFLRALFGLPFVGDDLATFAEFTGRQTAPTGPFREAYVICGRRSGKTRIASLVAVYLGCRRRYSELLAPSEQAVIPLLGADRRQAAQALNFTKGILATPTFRPFLTRALREQAELNTGCVLEIKAASLRTTRGFTTPAIVADELGFWSSEESSEPDREVLSALRPGMTTLSDAVLLGLSTPYAKAGVLFEAFDRYYGDDTADVLVWVGPSLAMNSTLDRAIIDRALAQDPQAAAAEYLAQFRADVQTFIDLDALRAVVNPDRPLELPPHPGVSYTAACDPSGGSSDAFTVAVSHAEEDRAVLDLVRGRKAPFSPTAVVAEFAGLLKTFGLSEVHGDHYSAEWVREAFRKEGILYQPLEAPKSAIYLELLGPLNSERIELPDHKELVAQFAGLERRTSRAGKDTVDHRAGGHDDLANSAAAALVSAVRGSAADVWIQAAKEGVLSGPLSPAPAGAAPQPAATRTRLSRAPTSQRCQCGAVFNSADQISACPNCGAALGVSTEPPTVTAPAGHLPQLFPAPRPEPTPARQMVGSCSRCGGPMFVPPRGERATCGACGFQP